MVGNTAHHPGLPPSQRASVSAATHTGLGFRFLYGHKEGKQPQDLVDLYIDHYIEESEEQLTKEEQEDLLADIAAENARIEAERQK